MTDAPTTDAERLASFEARAEAAYDRMYDALHSSDATARYSDAKEALRDAIGLARSLGQRDRDAPCARLARISRCSARVR